MITLWITGFLCLLNIALAILFRTRRLPEILSYYAACLLELAVFVFALLFLLGIIQHIPFPLPPNLAFNRAEIGAALALGLGLFPAAYWHRVNLAELPKRIAADAKEINKRDGGVHVRKPSPGEWMN